jgi:hypothetical protein
MDMVLLNLMNGPVQERRSLIVQVPHINDDSNDYHNQIYKIIRLIYDSHA